MKCRLFGVIPGPNIATAEELLSKNRQFIDGIELRLDHFEKLDVTEVEGFVKSCGLPIMFT